MLCYVMLYILQLGLLTMCQVHNFFTLNCKNFSEEISTFLRILLQTCIFAYRSISAIDIVYVQHFNAISLQVTTKLCPFNFIPH